MFNRKVVKVICVCLAVLMAASAVSVLLYTLVSHRAIRFAGCSCFYIQFSQKNIDKLQITVII